MKFSDLYSDDASFGASFLPRHFTLPPSELHRDMSLQDWDNHPFVAFAAPRDHAKSTLKSLARPLRRTICADRKRYLVISQTSRFAGDWLRRIAEEVATNEYFKAIFGIRPGNPWRETEEINFFVGSKSRTILARGVGCQVRGEHVDDITIDDPEDLNLVRSEKQREKFADWFRATLIGGMEEQTTLQYIGTIIHQFCQLAMIVGNPGLGRPPRPGWKTRVYRAVLEGRFSVGEPPPTNPVLLWPEKCSAAFLQRQLDEMMAVRWNREYQNDPAPDEAVVFLEKCYVDRWYDSPPPPDVMKVCVSLDPNGGEPNKESGDFAALAAVGIIAKDYDPFHVGDVLVLEVDRGLWGFREMLENSLALYLKWKATCFFYESVQFQAAIGEALSQYASQKGHYPALMKLPSITSKEMRARSVADFGEKRRLWLPRSFPSWAHQEFFSFPVVDNDDVVDAIVGALRGIRMFSEAWGTQQVYLPDENKVAFREDTGLSVLASLGISDSPSEFSFDTKGQLWHNSKQGEQKSTAEIRKDMLRD